MKKIFAIALALVMVLSMASAFAMTCGTIDWACSTTTYNCGTATVEVVPYVVANDCDGKGASYVESNCAAAVFGQDVYYAVKVSIPKDINEEWWAAAELDVDLTGLTGFEATDLDITAIKTDAGDDWGEKALTYYVWAETVSKKTEWFHVNAADEDFDLSEVVMAAEVTNAKTAKVCAVLTSAVDPVKDGEFVEVGKYNIAWVNGKIVVNNGKDGAELKRATFVINSDDQIEYVNYVVGDVTYTLTARGFVDAAGKLTGEGCDPYNWLAAVMDYFKLDFRATCFTEKAFKANFGWDNEVKSCFTWSANATSIVDAECVVAIPKTGDASVLAWLF